MTLGEYASTVHGKNLAKILTSQERTDFVSALRQMLAKDHLQKAANLLTSPSAELQAEIDALPDFSWSALDAEHVEV